MLQECLFLKIDVCLLAKTVGEWPHYTYLGSGEFEQRDSFEKALHVRVLSEL